MAEASEAPTGGSILEDREGNLFGIAFDPVGNGNCGVEAIVVALIEDVGFVANELHSGDASRGGRQVRAREPPVHMRPSKFKNTGRFGAKLPNFFSLVYVCQMNVTTSQIGFPPCLYEITSRINLNE